MVTVTTEYFTFEVGDGKATSGLMRRVRGQGTDDLAYMAAGGEWVEDPSLLRHFIGEGDIVTVTATEAERIAASLGGTL